MNEEPIRIYIGTDPTQELGAKIFEYSVRRHTTAPVQFDTMPDVHWPYPKDKKNYPGTNFSFHRFAIPKLAGYKGKALYVDADMLVLRDIRELWNTPFEGASVLCAAPFDPRSPKREANKRQLSVMLLDCDNLDWNVETIITEGLDAGKFDYQQLLTDLCIVPPDKVRDNLPPEWNSLEVYEPGKTGLLHYTHLTTQPWLSHRNRNGLLWLEYLCDAVRDGVITRAEIHAAMQNGWARPSLLSLLDVPRPLWRLREKTVSRLMDRGFEPHQELRERQSKAKREAQQTT